MKILYITTIGGTMPFFTTLIHSLIEDGNIVDIAANITDSDVPSCYREWGCNVYPLSCSRNPYDRGNVLAIGEISRIVVKEKYNLVHCHTPIAAMCTRLACRKFRKSGLKVFYTAHGFHFYKGAPFKNWLLYYPVEWICAHWTDVLITINKEDYALAQKHMHAKAVEYVPGVGIDLKKFDSGLFSRESIEAVRQELGLKDGEKMLLSVGELIPRKNHESVIRAVAKLNNPKIKYFICGTGKMKDSLEKLTNELCVSANVKFLGYREDVSLLCQCADLFVFPSLQEGLPVALMEAMASKTSIICSKVRGNIDLADENALFEPLSISEIVSKIEEYITEDKSLEVERNYMRMQKYDIAGVMKEMRDIYRGGVKHLDRILEMQLLRKSIGVPIDAILIFSVGELNSNKNHEVVIRAISNVIGSNVHYMIAGEGNLRDYLADLSESLGVSSQIHLLGYRSDIVDLYRIADLYIHPSLREGLSVALMEAMASGMPIGCSRIRGNEDLVDDGKGGWLCMKNTPDEYKRIIEIFVEDVDYYISMGCYNREKIKEFSKERVNLKMEKLYSKVVNM